MPTLMNNSSVHYVKFLRGSIQAWENLLLTPNKIDDDTLYFIYESAANTREGKLYLGQKLISGVGGNSSGIVNINDIGDINIDGTNLIDKQILVYNETTDKWENTSLSTIISTAVGEMVGATSAAAGAAGLVPAPQAGDQNKFLRGDKSWAAITLPVFDSNVFQSNARNEITLVGIETAPIGSIPVNTSSGIQWQNRASGTLSRSIVTMAQLEAAVEQGTADESTIYMVAVEDESSSTNKYDEYLVVNGGIELIGTLGEVNLDNYVTNSTFQSTIGNLNSILYDHVDAQSGETVPGLMTRVQVIEGNYVKTSQIGDLSTLVLSNGNTTLVQEINTINEEIDLLNERLQWQELEEE